MIVIMFMNLNLHNAKTIEGYSKALYIKLKKHKNYSNSFLKEKCFKLLFKNGEAATCSYS